MKKQITLLLLMLSVTLVSTQMKAQQQVLYLNNANASQEEGTSVPGDDAITRMLDADANFQVTTGTIDGSGVITPADLSPYDLIIVQENVSSGSAAFKPDAGPLALKNLTVPVIYCKSEAFRNGNAITDVTAPVAAIAGPKGSTSVTVDPSNQGNDLFSGIDFSGGNDIRLFYTTANGNGTPGNDAIKVLNNLDISNAAGGTLATTPEVTDVAKSVVINYIPAGTQLGESAGDVATVDIAIFAYNYGVQVKGDGSNMTSEALTIWRNTAYKLTGQTIPTTLYENPDELSLVLYLNNANASQEEGTSVPGDDAITRMLDADANFIVTAGTIDGSGVISPADLSPYDLIIVQETVSSGNAAFKPDAGALALKNLTVPVIYCKSEAFRNGNAITDVTAPVAAIAGPKGSTSVTVPMANQSNELFNGIDFTGGDDIRLFFETANGNGTPGNDAIKVLNNLDISNAAGGTLATTPEVTDVAKSVVINHIPAGTQLGENAGDVATVDIVAFAFNYGVQVKGDGTNVTSELLTIWRNAAYMLTGKTVPTTLYVNTQEPKQILYVNQTGVGQGAGASAPGADPVIEMLRADTKFFVTYIETPSDGSLVPDLSGFDLVIAQENISSGANLFKPGGVLGVKDVTIPIIYNKTYAFRNGLAITDATAPLAAVTPTQNVSVTARIPAHPLFNGIDFSGGNEVRIFAEATAMDNGSVGGTKAIDVLNDIDISSPQAASLATTPQVTDFNKAFVINYIPSGTQLGESATDVLQVNAVALSFSYGAMILGDGANISPQALTIWRNAAYALIFGLGEVPTTLVSNPDFTLSIDKVGEVSNVSSNVRAIGNRIYVSDVKSTTEVKIYSITGALVKSFKTNQDTDFQFNSGLWIATVKTYEGAKAVKLLTK